RRRAVSRRAGGGPAALRRINAAADRRARRARGRHLRARRRRPLESLYHVPRGAGRRGAAAALSLRRHHPARAARLRDAGARGGGWRAALPGGTLAAWIAVMGWAFVHWPLLIDDRPAIRTYVGIALNQIATEIRAHPSGDEVYIENSEVPGYVLGPMLHHSE